MRCIEIRLPEGGHELLTELLKGRGELWSWFHGPGETSLHRIVLPADEVEPVLDALQSRYSGNEAFHAMVLPVSAILPAPIPAKEEPQDPEEEARKQRRIAREELRATMRGAVEGGTVFRATVVLSAIVATIGLVQNSPAVVIGAMVIAPLLGPNMALALATALGDRTLLRDALVRNLEGLCLAAASVLVLGLFYKADPEVGELAARTRLTPSDLLLALASGAAGALAFTSGVSATLVGVMVAVALLPPLATAVLFLAGGEFELALRAAMLVWGNLVCINLSAVGVFLWQKVRPRTWWEQRASVRLAHAAFAVWGASLIVTLALIWFGWGDAPI